MLGVNGFSSDLREHGGNFLEHLPTGPDEGEGLPEAIGSEDVPRMRLGIGPVPPGLGEEGLAGFVLAPFPAEERDAVERLIERAAAAGRTWIDLGIEAAMSRANAPDLPPAPAAG